MPEISKTRFVIAVQDLEASAAFYKDKLGFEILELGAPGWLTFSKGACIIMAGECPDDEPAASIGSHSYFAYLTVDDVDDYHARVVANGVSLMKDLTAEPWGMREFGVTTIDGHRIMFGGQI
jgi:uncharacterized glyoxalase superfamily protein PhnB